MDLNIAYYNIDPDTSYNIIEKDGEPRVEPSDQTPPEGSTTLASGISGSTIQKDIRKEQKNLWNLTSQSKDNAEQQEQEMTDQYYSYLTNGASSSGNLCMM